MAYIKHEDLCGAFKGNCFRCSIFFGGGGGVYDKLTNSLCHSSPASPSSSGDTLLAIRAPIGTQLEVPIPESVSQMCGLCTLNASFVQSLLCLVSQTGSCALIQVLNGQRKYQIRLKSSTGPIEVLLVNKDPSSASPVVLPVPPPDDVLQSLPAPTPTSQLPTAVSQVQTNTSFLTAISSIHILMCLL